jgi:6-phosphogluconate dehydrogenase
MMRPVAKLYREFCLQTAQMLEDEANRYARHPALQDEDRQFIDVLRQQCREWKQQIERLDRAQVSAWGGKAG